MADEKSNLLTAGKIAVQLGVSGGAVSKAIKTLDIKQKLDLKLRRENRLRAVLYF